MFGHSVGGAAAAAAMVADPRITAGLNMDGILSWLDGSLMPVATLGLDRPYLLLGKDGTTDTGPGWQAFLAHTRGWARQLTLRGRHHRPSHSHPHPTGLHSRLLRPMAARPGQPTAGRAIPGLSSNGVRTMTVVWALAAGQITKRGSRGWFGFGRERTRATSLGAGADVWCRCRCRCGGCSCCRRDGGRGGCQAAMGVHAGGCGYGAVVVGATGVAPTCQAAMVVLVFVVVFVGVVGVRRRVLWRGLWWGST
jgi:hypothetical protein